MAIRDHRAAAVDYSDNDVHTSVDGRRRPGPRFVQAETVMPTVSYRGQLAAPAPPTPPIQVVSSVQLDLEPSVIERMPVAARTVSPPSQFLSQAPQRRGELTVVFSCRGGGGATTLAVNTAALIARGGRSVCIVDLDLQLGDVCAALDVTAQTSLSSVAREVHTLDGVSLRRRLAQHGSGICALSQAGHLDDLDPQLPARLPQLLDTLRTHFDHVIVDGVRDFGDLALAALEGATRILVVVTQDVPSVRRAARVLGLFGALGIPEAKCALVVNRVARRAAIDDAAIERALAMKIAAHVREEARVGEALDTGALLVDVARTRPVIRDLARVATLCRPADATPSTRASSPRRWFHLFRGGS
jgi:pilus assembly protein CpaE